MRRSRPTPFPAFPSSAIAPTVSSIGVFGSTRCWLFRRPDADFVEVPQQVGGILIDPVRPGPFQLILAIAA